MRGILTLVGLVTVVGVGGIAWQRHGRPTPTGWAGKVTRIVAGGGGARLGGSRALGEGDAIVPGAEISTDRRQRARIEMTDGTVLVLDRDTDIVLDPSPGARTVHVKHGVLAADVAHLEDAAPAKVLTARGDMTVIGTELVVTATDDTTDLMVGRGSVRATTNKGDVVDVQAGQEALLSATDAQVGLSSRTNALLEESPTPKVGTGGIGELRARRPGHEGETDRPLRIASHAVKVRIAGAMARTEVEETFANDTDDVLEGIYRFPIPAGASVDRLALDVDDKLVDGSFVEKTRAEKILRGALANAAPKEHVQDIIWVPGPWRDPALLEWQQGGRFELRIFPIPKHGSRHVVIGYTQTVTSALGARRYTYPLPSVGGVRMDDFSLDLQVLGADDRVPVRVRGYELTGNDGRFTMHQSAFMPTGDLEVDYILPNHASEMSAWTYDGGDAGRYAVFALRPKLRPTAEAAPRDWVVVVDSGRTMFGERSARAREVATALAHTLDRRDRMRVLACDVVCRQNPEGFVPAGIAAAKATEAFLATVVPQGGSDLVEAVRSASALRDGRELRVVLVSDGMATAGYKRPTRVAQETHDAVGSGAAVLTVAVGADGDDSVLSEIARGGGGIDTRYAPGDDVDEVALALAGAGAGTLLANAELTLPDGLETTAPAMLPTLRVGGETFVAAKMTSADVKGDVVLRSGSFESRWPVELHASGAAGNAFVPRLYAGLRMRDLERTPGDDARKEAVMLSQRFSVPSGYTSLLVLESEAMFKAFGIDRKTLAPRWTGEEVGESIDATTPDADAKIAAASDELSTMLASNEQDKEKGSPAATASAAPLEQRATAGGMGARLAPMAHMAMRRRIGRFMRRVSHREAIVAPLEDGATIDAGVTQARAVALGSPDDRGKQQALARALLKEGSYDDLRQVVAAWQQRDPLDVEALGLAAEGVAERGGRSAAAHMLTGIAGSVDPARLDELARGDEALGAADVACALRIAAAESTPDDSGRVARAVRCERARGRDAAASRWLGEPGRQRSAIEAALQKETATTPVTGDVVLDATWEGDEDVDLALVDPNGQRLGWLDGRARVSDATSHSHERLGTRAKPNGRYLVEVVRTTSTRAHVHGFVTITSFGTTRRVLFDLGDARTSMRVATVDTKVVTELVPIDDWSDETTTFDPNTARARLLAVPLTTCVSDIGTPGTAAVTFLPSGTVSSVVIAPPYAGTTEGVCVARRLRTAWVDPFPGAPRTITARFAVPPKPTP